ncbi:MAG: pyridoxal 5'-phosphate synthase glutaminase subunit PdxT [bacterium]|nr:pyridoxal 5'-phosphate synthase glutaminase subunit PdxT [bacterium]
MLTIGVLALQGDVSEHIEAVKNAAKKLHKDVAVISVREKKDLAGLDALIMPGGESTTFYKLCQRAGIFEGMKKIPNILGTCAGAIMLSKNAQNKTKDQVTLQLMDIEVARNAYGRQNESFEADIKTSLGAMHAIFIRAPKITRVGKNVRVLAEYNNEILACEEEVSPVRSSASNGAKGNYYLALAFHPELTTTLFHEYFLRRILAV